jgi:hypothetical protein
MLFSPSDLKIKPNKDNTLAISAIIPPVSIREQSGKALASSFPEYQENLTCVTLSKKWFQHEMLTFFSQIIKSGNCFVASWSITEEPARKLVALKQSGQIAKLSCLFGERLRVLAPASLQLIIANADQVKLTRSHAKVVTLFNSYKGVTIIGSANFSKNARLEAHTVIYSQTIASEVSENIQKHINDGFI